MPSTLPFHDGPEPFALGPSFYDRARCCLLCGADLIEREIFGRLRKRCSACEFVLFRSPGTGAACVVARGREVLLVQRGIQPYKGEWGLPAGYQEYGESAADAAVRETQEETGMEVRIVRMLDLVYTRDDVRKEANLVVFLATVVAGTLQAADDAADARWFTLDALPEALSFANNRLLLQRLAAEFPTGDIQ